MNYEQTNEVDSLESSKLTFEELLELDEKRTQAQWYPIEIGGAVGGYGHTEVWFDTGLFICNPSSGYSGKDSEQQANAQFIAAAPEMMKLLKKYREALESIVDMSHMDYETCASKARRALDD